MGDSGCLCCTKLSLHFAEEALKHHPITAKYFSLRGTFPAQYIDDIVTRQATLTPSAPAIRDALTGWQATYAELLWYSQRIKETLERKGSCRGKTVAIFLPPGYAGVAAILAVLRSGAIYVPLDPATPSSRAKRIVKDANVWVVVTCKKLNDKALEWWEGCEENVLVVDYYVGANEESKSACGYQEESERLDMMSVNGSSWCEADSTRSSDVAYIIYTSGSTGCPKGVQGTHSAILHRLRWIWETFPFKAAESCLHRTSLSFVDSVSEIFATLGGCGCLVVLESEKRNDVAILTSLLNRKVMSRMTVVPTLLRLILSASSEVDLSGLNVLISSGEALSKDLARQLLMKMRNNATLANVYGSSETAGDIAWYTISPESLVSLRNNDNYIALSSNTVPIGRPIFACGAVVLEEGRTREVEQGMIGEIVVHGPVVCDGYYQNDLESCKKFLQYKKKKFFRTGDLGWIDNEGIIHICGRVDSEVKIHGNRVNISEVESVILRICGVKSAVVIVEKQGASRRQLVAFIASDGLDSKAIRRHCMLWLPPQSIPTRIIVLPDIPLLPSGKVDRVNLSKKLTQRETQGRSIEAGADTLEDILSRIKKTWAEVLPVSDVGREVSSVKDSDNFFDCGGDSFAAAELVANYQPDESHSDLFFQFYKDPTPRGLAKLVLSCERTDDTVGVNECDVASTASLNTRAPKFRIEPLQRHRHKDTSALVADCFTEREPLLKSARISNGSKRRLRRWYAKFTRKVVESRLSYVAIDEESNRVVGFTLNDFLSTDSNQESRLRSIREKSARALSKLRMPMSPVSAVNDLFDDLIRTYSSLRSWVYKPQEAMQFVFAGVSLEVSGPQVHKALDRAALQHAEARGVRLAITICTSKASALVARSLGFKLVCSKNPYSHEYKGRRYFAGNETGYLSTVELYEKRLGPHFKELKASELTVAEYEMQDIRKTIVWKKVRQILSDAFVHMWDRLDKAISRSTVLFALQTRDVTIGVALCRLFPDAGRAELILLAIERRWQHRGCGSILVKEVVSKFCGRGCTMIAAFSLTSRRNFYFRLGWRVLKTSGLLEVQKEWIDVLGRRPLADETLVEFRLSSGRVDSSNALPSSISAHRLRP